MSPDESSRCSSENPAVRVTFLGSGDAFGTGGRFQTCIALTVRSNRYLLDCGASSLIAMRRCSFDPNSIRTILLTHLHGDHFGGLPFFILDAQLYAKRSAPLIVAGPRGTRERIRDAMEVLFPGSSKVEQRFEITYAQWEDGRATTVADAVVTPFAMGHGSGATSFALRVAVDGRTLCYSGDTEWTPALPVASRDVDVFIVEALSFEKKVKYHLDYKTLHAHWSELTAHRVVLTHMGPEMLARVSAAHCEVAHDGMELLL